MAHGNPFVAKVAVELKDALDAPNQEAFEKEFRRHPQVEIQIQRVVVGDKRPGRRASGDGLHHRRLHLQKIPLLKKAPNETNNPRAPFKHLSDLLIDHEIDIPLPVAGLDIRQTMPFLRQRPQTFAEQADSLGVDGQLLGLGAKERPPNRYNVTDIEELEKPVPFFPQPVPAPVNPPPAPPAPPPPPPAGRVPPPVAGQQAVPP